MPFFMIKEEDDGSLCKMKGPQHSLVLDALMAMRTRQNSPRNWFPCGKLIVELISKGDIDEMPVVKKLVELSKEVETLNLQDNAL